MEYLMLSQLLKNFKNPGSALRGAPFWAWNSALDPETLREQIRNMKAMGFGGFYMHSRTGLDTPYLSDQWFECISSCIDEAEKLDMEAWLYDEDRWPSGAAGGIVTADDRFKMRKLKYCQGNPPESGNLLARFILEADGNHLLNARRLPDDETVSGDFYSFYWEYMERSSWYNGETYLDTMNRDAVQEFINVTHEEYRKRYQDKFGKSVPGIFSDEPCYIHGDVILSMPWTPALPEEFRKSYGYDLMDNLPELFFFAKHEVSRVRHDYYDLITRLFTENFTGTIGKWCGKHNFAMTGHTLAEDYLSGQVLYAGAAMRFYEHMQVPGVDVLTEHWNVFNTVKQCTSAARQFGRERVLTESYACTGWDFPISGHKALCDWQFALGVNQRCLHLTWYSLEAEAKRDYPASISKHSPWHAQYPVVEDYFARMSAVLIPGDEIRDLLVIHPIESVWSVLVKDIPATDAERERRQIKPGTKAMDGFYSEQVAPLDRAHSDLTNTLLAEHLDFDFGDEEHISRFGSIREDKFILGKAEYSMVLIPQLKTIRSTTLKLLKEFKGKVFYIGNPPEFVDALPSSEAKELFKKFIPVDPANPAEAISRRVSITAGKKQASAVLYRLAALDSGYTFMLCNTSMPFTTAIKEGPMVRDRNIAYPELAVSIAVPAQGDLFELDPVSGKITPVDFQYSEGMYCFDTGLDILQSRLYIISKENIATAAGENAIEFSGEEVLPETEFSYQLSEPNRMVLDRARWRVDNGQWHENNYILLIDDELREMLASAPRGGLMAQPWRWDKNRKWQSTALELEYNFTCDILPAEDCILYLEHPELYTIELNGTILPAEKCGFWMDKVLQGIRIPLNFLKEGDNQLLLRCTYHCGLRGLESMYIAGCFGVKGDSTITALPEKLTVGDWCKQNLPNFAGNLTYAFDCEIASDSFLDISEWRGTMLGIRIDDNGEVLLPWPPYQTKIGAGKHRVEITVYGHRRNALGPFYLNEKWPVRTGPYQHKVYEHPERQLVPCGLLAMPKLKKIKK